MRIIIIYAIQVHNAFTNGQVTKKHKRYYLVSLFVKLSLVKILSLLISHKKILIFDGNFEFQMLSNSLFTIPPNPNQAWKEMHMLFKIILWYKGFMCTPFLSMHHNTFLVVDLDFFHPSQKVFFLKISI